ncbi:MAG: universal stress protein, partial [Dehalococcoidia bacterium]|nr:universal stress protein [Dehalococcoidia bacterium]
MFKRILAALDGSQLAEYVLPYVLDLAGRFRSQVHLVTVTNTTEEGLGLGRAFEAYLAHLGEKLKNSGAAVKTALLSGNPSEKILDYATEKKIDLIAITTIGKGGPGRWKLGSVAEKLSTASAVPVLLVPTNNSAGAPSGPFFTRILVPV